MRLRMSMPCGCQPNTYFFVGSNGGVVRIKRAGKYACDSAQIGCVRSASHGLPSLNSLPSRNEGRYRAIAATHAASTRQSCLPYAYTKIDANRP